MSDTSVIIDELSRLTAAEASSVAQLLREKLAAAGQPRSIQLVSIKIDDTITDSVCDYCVGFVTLKKNEKSETVAPAGTGTFAKIGPLYGILTAGHVLGRMGLGEQIGLVRFSILQRDHNRRLDLDKTEREVLWNGRDGDAPDIAFLKLADVDGRALEAEGAVFYDLDRMREFKAESGGRPAKCHVLAGEVGEWADPAPEQEGKAKKVEIGGLFGAVKNLREFKEDETELIESEIDRDAGLRFFNSHGGISGGGLWELQVEIDQTLKPLNIQKRLVGVAFRETEDKKRVISNARASIDAIAKATKARWLQHGA